MVFIENPLKVILKVTLTNIHFSSKQHILSLIKYKVFLSEVFIVCFFCFENLNGFFYLNRIVVN